MSYDTESFLYGSTNSVMIKNQFCTALQNELWYWIISIWLNWTSCDTESFLYVWTELLLNEPVLYGTTEPITIIN